MSGNEHEYNDSEMTDEELVAIISRYERQFNMTTTEFLKKWMNDEIPDTFEANDWAILADYLPKPPSG